MIATKDICRLKLGFTWCYLLECSGGLVLVDTSFPKYFDSFQKQLNKLGRHLADIRYLVLTHHHDDHAGFAAELINKTGCRVIVHRDAIVHLEQGRSEDVTKPVNRRVKFVFSLYALFRRGYTFPPVPISPQDIMVSCDDSSFLKTVGVDGRILHTPGHYRDCISVVLSDGAAFVGDAAMNFLSWTGIAHRPIYVEDRRAVHESWQKLLEAGAKVIYPAHGRPFPSQELIPRHG